MGFMLVSGCTSLLRRTWNARDSPVKVSLCNLFCLFPSGTVSTGEEISFSFNVLSLTTLLLYEVRLNKLFLPRILISWEIRVVKQ